MALSDVAKIGKLSSQFLQPCLFVGRIDDDRPIERLKGLYQRFGKPAPWVARRHRQEIPGDCSAPSPAIVCSDHWKGMV